ncbi:hypothetical protein QSV34_05590 [Porticoccus sp. W117]|uniref:hypothetical protein n=1 Tax=Porticoccus sp. W117 TaxID=3054777 RepID=UPI002595482F|nr:hypothetical protein [Porticoccus sp. W117]MDM3870823.1 hypothetical protein [Porticoccus sp. W117]
MNVDRLRQAIAAAREHEAETDQLSQFLQGRIGELHRSIQLPVDNSVPALLNFVIRYIEHVPEFVEAVSDISKQAGIEPSIEPVIQVACEFFLSPPGVMEQWLEEQNSLVALMDEAYLAHRLIEEVNDRYMTHLGAPLVPMDMTRSNLIVHHLIGEDFANQLDRAVEVAVNQLQQRQADSSKLTSFVDRCRQRDIDRELIRWPCLTDSLSINLMLDGRVH